MNISLPSNETRVFVNVLEQLKNKTVYEPVLNFELNHLHEASLNLTFDSFCQLLSGNYSPCMKSGNATYFVHKNVKKIVILLKGKAKVFSKESNCIEVETEKSIRD